jgi:TetR/AcrR family transcriptional regulator, regulator of cefoperazone and chloramphenicol sensitivity
MKARRQGSKVAQDPLIAEDTRSELLQAASEVFAECGYRAATIRKICARAGANVALVNYHFGDKQELYTEVLRQSVSAKHEAIRSALDQDGEPKDVLKQVIRAMVFKIIAGDAHDLRFRLMLHELAQPTPALSLVINEAIRPTYNQLRKIIGVILRLPEDHEKTRLCTHSIVGQIAHYVHARPMLACLWPELKMTPQQLERIAKHIAEFSVAYLEAGRSKQRHLPAAKLARRRK